MSGWEKLHRLVKRVPKGRVVTYGQLAKAVRLRGGARAAGRALAACPKGRGIPWHRVVGAGGKILVRESVAALQRRLLESEGVAMINGQVQLAIYGWRFSPKKRRFAALPRGGHQLRSAVSSARDML
jgi:methylated-DNA-protein-cysteine methyltransferase related protein